MSDNIFIPGKVLIPESATLSKWSVVACDQYTSEPEYWSEVEKIVADAPSTLRLTLPEIFLSESDVDERIERINATMNAYLEKGLFKEINDRFIYVEREQSNSRTRRGLIGVIDLERYSYAAGSKTPVRATEGTVLERIPPRVRVRKNAPLELPHIMILIDDPKKTVIEKIPKNSLSPLYGFSLMQGGGRIDGFEVSKEECARISDALDKLDGDLRYAVGDGNHSLATAKECYEQNKTPLSRYALVEVVNLHDDSLEFEPIHRVLFNVDPQKLLAEFPVSDTPTEQSFTFVSESVTKKLYIKNITSNLTVGSLQSFLDGYIKENGAICDYVHGDEVATTLGSKPGCCAFLLPAMEKSQLFKTVIKDGALPRKTFSMGHAQDKRFYLEARKITLG